MIPCTATLRHWLLAAACALPLAAQAGPTFSVPYAGTGNLIYDSVSATGAWAGSIVEVPPTIQGDLPDMVSVVFFSFDAITGKLSGTFQFSDAATLTSTLFGTLSSDVLDAGFLTTGGLVGLDYTIRGGTGAYADANGFGLSFLTYDPTSPFNGGQDNYSESVGLLNFTVPEPGSLALAAAGLLALAWTRRRAAPIH